MTEELEPKNDSMDHLVKWYDANKDDIEWYSAWAVDSLISHALMTDEDPVKITMTDDNFVKGIRDLALAMAEKDGFWLNVDELWMHPTTKQKFVDYLSYVDAQWGTPEVGDYDHFDGMKILQHQLVPTNYIFGVKSHPPPLTGWRRKGKVAIVSRVPVGILEIRKSKRKFGSKFSAGSRSTFGSRSLREVHWQMFWKAKAERLAQDLGFTGEELKRVSEILADYGRDAYEAGTKLQEEMKMDFCKIWEEDE